MTEEITKVEPESLATKEDQLPITSIVARDPAEMAAAQAHVTGWVVKKLAAARHEVRDFDANIAEAKKHKWKSSGMSRLKTRAVERVNYYDKIKTALDAGFYIVPNFPCDVFAIRFDEGACIGWKDRLAKNWSTDAAKALATPALPAGEGEYRNADAEIRHESSPREEDGNGKTIKAYEEWWHAVALQDVDFPLVVAKPAIMTETARAMALKVFDEIGVLPERMKTVRRAAGDPMVIGRVVMKASSKYGKDTRLSFLIAWILEETDL